MIFQLWEVVDILHIQQGSELTLTLCLTKGKYVKLKTMAYKRLYKYTISLYFFIHYMKNKMAENCIFKVFKRINNFL